MQIDKGKVELIGESIIRTYFLLKINLQLFNQGIEHHHIVVTYGFLQYKNIFKIVLFYL